MKLDMLISKSDPNILFIGLAGLLAIGLKLLHVYSTSDELLWLIMPVNYFVELFQGAEAVYRPDEGFYYEDFHIIIDKSCAGVNFFIIVFCVLTWLLIPNYKGYSAKLTGMSVLLLLSYFVTLAANISRINGAIFLLSFHDSIPFLSSEWLHEAEGAFVYLNMLVITFLIVRSIHLKMTTN